MRALRLGITALGCALSMSVVLGLTSSGQTAQEPTCDRTVYSSLDGRLRPTLVAVLPKRDEPVVGFEAVGATPLVAFPHSLWALRAVGGSKLAISHTVKALSFDSSSHVVLQFDDSLMEIGERGLEPAGKLSPVRGRLYGSGQKVFIEARSRQGFLQFLARREDGAAFPIAMFRGRLRAASWNAEGLAAVVGNSLYVWQAGGKSVVRLLTDQGLVSARDVVAVGKNRAVIALRNTVVLVTPETVDIIGMMPASRCRFQNGVLYVLEEQGGLIWALRGLDKLGSKDGDRAYARGLLQESQQDSAHRKAALAEAARIVGCSQLKNLISGPAETPTTK